MEKVTAFHVLMKSPEGAVKKIETDLGYVSTGLWCYMCKKILYEGLSGRYYVEISRKPEIKCF